MKINSQMWLVNVFLICLLMACGKGGGVGGPGNPANDGVLGTWSVLKMEMEGVRFDVKFRIDRDQVTSTVTCQGDGPEVVAVATASAELTSSQLKIKEHKQEAKPFLVKGKQSECTANLDPRTFDYKLLSDTRIEMVDHLTGERQVFDRL